MLECMRLLLERGANKEAKTTVRGPNARHCRGALRRRRRVLRFVGGGLHSAGEELRCRGLCCARRIAAAPCAC